MDGEFDWDRFFADGEELERRFRNVAEHCERRNAESRAARLRQGIPGDGSHSIARERPPAGNGTSEERLNRLETRLDRVEGRLDGIDARLDRMDGRLDRIDQTLAEMRVELSQIRERMATTVEVEDVRDSVRILADGYGQTQLRLAEVAALLRRYLTA